ncbi:aspartyl-tRNA(Asn)/glutamyl-tRNA(Gln) amidotransferase subunit A [Amycolatopsis arida]|uniref:Aspartyl-tRNA(Asn)/glutamyl-tRNA(Gln) amidotransferase subunit A n=1 Tax=Amycolatopsis arida TaxID=587909 RepID=A0A1I5TXN7_9PSEU|nr:amidase [Amycolatopsis arida]TDX95919.1 aspartyl-tRNA(Asn)/glutamyl-tRNA(Gln) amidotransferase subunit A [Amycolatopsis arida]SFP87798.1 aspartyl-tRNA(Asn)/glutamyl-tRNA(Gln) amidotransferase subunit A [Amycolatopsis arida]
MVDIVTLGAVELRDAYRKGELSPVEVTEAVLARVDALEPTLRALYVYDPEGARAAARAAEQRWRAGRPLGPVDGIPLTLKENIATRATPVPLGTAATELVPAPADAPAAARLRESGGVVLGKTTMPDYGMLTSGLSSLHPCARNPWDPTRTPGGSSAGAAAAAAAGYGPLHVGTDIGGSIRLPAGWCGLVGLKPSFGRVPVHPPFPGRVAGPMTRDVADAALLMEVLARPDERDHLSLPPAELPWGSPELDVAGARIGLQLEPGEGLAVEPEIRAAVVEAARLLEKAGAVVEPVEPFVSREMLDGLDRFWRTRALVEVAALPAERRERILPYIAEWIRGAEGLSGVDVYRGFAQLDALSVAALAACRPFDFVLSPVCPVGPPPAEWASPTNDPARPFEHIVFTVPYNMSGQPAVSINCGYTADGLPIGLQIAGRRFDDVGVLRLAAAFEHLRPPPHPWPTYPPTRR